MERGRKKSAAAKRARLQKGRGREKGAAANRS
jgi:hypothetical protein